MSVAWPTFQFRRARFSCVNIAYLHFEIWFLPVVLERCGRSLLSSDDRCVSLGSCSSTEGFWSSSVITSSSVCHLWGIIWVNVYSSSLLAWFHQVLNWWSGYLLNSAKLVLRDSSFSLTDSLVWDVNRKITVWKEQVPM